MDTEEILHRVSAINDCAQDIRTLTAAFEQLDTQSFEVALEEAMTRGAQKVIGRLLLCAGYLGRRLPPELLYRCLDAAERVAHSILAFRVLGEDAAPCLLEAAADTSQVFDRRIFALNLATELILKYDLDRQPATKVLWKMETSVEARYDESGSMVLGMIGGLLTLGSGSNGLPSVPWEMASALEDILPEHYQRKTVSHGAPLRRAVPKLGRNEPCHCGSGKKYKKCCYETDQELQTDASEFEGVTRSSLIENPGQVDDHRFIHEMRPFELQRLNPSSLTLDQLIVASRSARHYGLWELAFDMLKEAEQQGGELFHWGHYEDLLYEALPRGDLTFARRVRDRISDQPLFDPETVALQFELLENPKPYGMLDGFCRRSLLAENADAEAAGCDTPMQDLFFAVVERFPALGVVLGRALLAADQESYLDVGMVLDQIRRARVDLDLSPWGDPAETLLDWIDDRDQLKARERKDSEQAKLMKEQLRATRKELDRKQHELQDRELEVRQLGRDLEQMEDAQRNQDAEVSVAPSGKDPQRSEEREEMLARLRAQVNNLKSEISEQQQERRRLRSVLSEERRRFAAATKDAQVSAGQDEAEATEATSPQPIGRILIPEYSSAFTKHCTELPPQVAADALQAIGDFAAHDRSVWRNTKPLERLHDHYRMRIGIDYRLLFRWKPGESLRILDIIRRRELEVWIRRHG